MFSKVVLLLSVSACQSLFAGDTPVVPPASPTSTVAPGVSPPLLNLPEEERPPIAGTKRGREPAAEDVASASKAPRDNLHKDGPGSRLLGLLEEDDSFEDDDYYDNDCYDDYDYFFHSLPNHTELKEYLDRYVIGHDDVKMRLITAVLDHYSIINHDLRADSDEDHVEITKPNILLVGGTGTGKTYIIETLAKKLGVPFVSADASVFTREGYIGGKADSVFDRLYDEANEDLDSAHRGIIFFDEIDKLAKKDKDEKIDVAAAVQGQLLKMVVGKEIKIERGKKITKIDTKRILFVMAGAFSEMPHPKGSEIDPTELIKYGMVPEFIGRMSCILKLNEMTKEMLLRILEEPKNAPLKQQIAKFSWQRVKLELTDSAKEAVVAEALKRKLGARDLYAILTTCLDGIRMSKTELNAALTEGRKLIIDGAFIRSRLPKEPDKVDRLAAYKAKFEAEDRIEALREEEARHREEHERLKGKLSSFGMYS